MLKRINLLEKQYRRLKNIIYESASYGEEFGEYGELIDIDYIGIVEKSVSDKDDEYTTFFIERFTLISLDECRLNEEYSFYELCDMFGDDTAWEMEDNITNGEKISEEKDGDTIVIKYKCHLSLNTVDDLIKQRGLDGFLKSAIGTTTNCSLGIWMLEDGTMLNGSENGQYRTLDHNVIDSFIDGGYEKAMDMGIIRLMPESPGIEVHRLPSSSQMEALARYINYFRDSTFYIDLNNGVGAEYRSPHHFSKILSDIEDYFCDGIKPLLKN